jgi:phage-related protein
MPVASLLNYRFAFNDFEFGGGDSVYQILSVEGLESLPEIRNQDDNRGYQDGMFTGRDFLGGRSIIIEMYIFGDSTHSMQYNLDLLQRNLVPQQQGTGLLQFQLPNNALQRINARVRNRATSIDVDYSSGRGKAIYEFFCPDPRYYDDTLNTQDITASATPTGRTYDRVYDLDYGGGATTGIITNTGWYTTYPTITITGPAVNPRVINNSTGQSLLIDYTLQATDILVLDTDYRTVTINGVNRRAILNNASAWFAAPPGTSLYSFQATGTGVGTSCVVTWRNAFI